MTPPTEQAPTNLYFKTGRVLIGDALKRLKELPSNSVDSVICDPPYGLSSPTLAQEKEVMLAWLTTDPEAMPKGAGFMNRSWDSYVPPPALWAEVLRVLKPGGFLTATAGSRTQHLLAWSIRLGGFDIRDGLVWLYAQGAPNSPDVSQKMDPADAAQWVDYRARLKPAFEPSVVARKPLSEPTIAANVLRWGTGALNVGACRVGGPGGRYTANVVLSHSRYCVQLTGGTFTATAPTEVSGGIWAPSTGKPAGPTYTDQPATWDCAEGCAVAELDAQSGHLTSGLMKAGQLTAGYTGPCMGEVKPGAVRNTTYGDSGGASRFFNQTNWQPDLDGTPPYLYCAKATKRERNTGLTPCDCPAPPPRGRRPENLTGLCATCGGVTAAHETVKPLSWMAHLIRLLTPAGGVVLDPFLGSGSTAVAAIHEGFRFIGCELTAEYLPILTGRITHAEALWCADDDPGTDQAPE